MCLSQLLSGKDSNRSQPKSGNDIVGIACVIGIPIAVYAAQEYLKDFIYKLEGYWWIFVVAVLLSSVIAFASVIWQTLKAAKTNPAIELKKE